MGKYNSKEMAERSFGLDIRGKIAKWENISINAQIVSNASRYFKQANLSQRAVSLKSDVRSIAHRVASKKRLL